MRPMNYVAIFLLFSIINLSHQSQKSNFIKAFHLDCGRKYFSKEHIKEIIRKLHENNYNALELAFGYDGLRFLLNNMTINANNKIIKNKDISGAIKESNKNYQNAGKKNELTQKDMDEIIKYAKKRGIQIIPLLNSPGHMDSLLFACNRFFSRCSFHKSKSSIDLSNELAMNFTISVIEKYVQYFKGKTKYFNIGGNEYAIDIFPTGYRGFGKLQKDDKYSLYIKYINRVAAVIDEAGMSPIAFNDGFYFGGVTSQGKFDKKIIVAYWKEAIGKAKSMPAKVLQKMGYKILNANYKWHYVLNQIMTAHFSKKKFELSTLLGVKNIPYNYVDGAKEMEVEGCMVSFLCDEPRMPYDDYEKDYLIQQVEEFRDANEEIFGNKNKILEEEKEGEKKEENTEDI